MRRASPAAAGRKLLITGALGHIGAHLIRNVEGPYEEVILLDSLESRRFPSLYHLPRRPYRYRFVRADILTADFDGLLAETKASTLVHLAAITDAEGSHKMPEAVEATNYHGLKRVADACLRNKVALLFPSTTSVYGSQATLVDETCRELKPQSPYAEAKLNSEVYLRGLGKQGLDFIICRFGTIFGHSIGMRYDTAVNRFIWQAATGLPLTVWKTAWKQKRPYLWLGDCVSAINLLLARNRFDGGTYNVLTRNFTVEDVVSAIREFVPRLVVEYVDSPIMNQLSYEVDDSRFRKEFRFSPIGDLRQAIAGELEVLAGILPAH
jgi:nucleoside-diphosphate-sugar epimerase